MDKGPALNQETLKEQHIARTKERRAKILSILATPMSMHEIVNETGFSETNARNLTFWLIEKNIVARKKVGQSWCYYKINAGVPLNLLAEFGADGSPRHQLGD